MLAEITALITAYKYWAIVPFALFEAPLMSIVIGFFAATGQLNLFLAFGIVVLGDFTGDTVLYGLGRWGQPLLRKAAWRLNSRPVQAVLDHFARRSRRAIVISKLVHGIGFTGLIVAGSIKVPYRRFALTCAAVTIVQSGVLAAIGMLSGSAYQTFAHYLGYFNFVATAGFLLIAVVLYRSVVRKIVDEKISGS